MTGNNIKYICGYLNSKLSVKQLLENSPKTGTGDVIISVQALEPHRIPPMTPSNEPIVKQIEALVDKILAAKQSRASILAGNIRSRDASATLEFEKEIDELVYRLYQLTPEEIRIIEGGKS